MGTTRLNFQDRNEEYTYVLVEVQPAARKEVELYAKLLLSSAKPFATAELFANLKEGSQRHGIPLCASSASLCPAPTHHSGRISGRASARWPARTCSRHWRRELLRENGIYNSRSGPRAREAARDDSQRLAVND